MTEAVIAQAIQKLASEEEYEVEYALRVIINSAVEPAAADSLTELGGVEPLVPLLGSNNPVLQMLAAWALSNLASGDSGRRATILRVGTVKLLNPILTGSARFELGEDEANEAGEDAGGELDGGAVEVQVGVNSDVLTKVMWLLTNLSHTEKNRKYLAACRVPRHLAALLQTKSQTILVEVCKPLRNLLLELDSQKLFVQAGGLLHVVQILNSSSSSPEIIAEVLNLLLTLSVGTHIMRKLIVAAGALPPIVLCLSGSNLELANLAVQVLISLSLTTENEERILQAGGILPVVDLFTGDNFELKEQAALLLSNLSVNEKIRENLRYCGLVPQLVDLLDAATTDSPDGEPTAAHLLLEQACRLLTNLAMDDVNRCELLDAGALEKLEPLTATADPGVKAAAELGTNNLRVPVPLAVKEQMLAQQKERQQSGGGKFLNPQLLRREKIASELLETERSYVSGLKLAVELYLRPCMDSVVKDVPIIPGDSVRILFGVIEVIYKTNHGFLEELEDAMAAWEAQQTCIGPLLQDFAQQLKVYTRFINAYDQIVSCYSECLENQPRFTELIDTNRAHPEVRGRDLMSFLIMPVQRVPRYVMLLEDMIRHTPATHADKNPCEQALVSVRELADFLNESKRAAEAAQRVVTLSKQLEFNSATSDGGKWELVQPDRVLVREGSLLERSPKTKASKYCQLFLLTDVLLHTLQKKQKYKVKARIMLSSCVIEQQPDTDVLKNAFHVKWGGKEELTLVANSPQERSLWLRDLLSAIDALKA